MHAPAPARPPVRNNRVLVIDDNPAIHADVRKILCPTVSAATRTLEALEAEMLGTPTETRRIAPTFTVDSAHQGREGLELLQRAVSSGQPYSMAFVDIRMPPGWDGVETTLELWKVAPDLQIVICTAYSDYSWDELLAKLGTSDRLVVLKKPFDTIEVFQLANALTEKWNLVQQARAHAADLESRVHARTAELAAANQTLQDEIVRRIEVELDLKRAKEAAESADRAKSAFLANMSHEIRTPMNGVIGMANLLLSSPLSSDQRELALTLCQSSESLLTIINEILDFSKIEAGRMELESVDFDLAEHLELAVDLHAEAAARKSLELVQHVDSDVPSRLRGDPVRFRQVLLNLLSNAIKFTRQGEVVLRVASAGRRGGRSVLRFEVADSGIGVPASVQSSLFQPFVQADTSTTRRFGGTGLGLAISKRLVELMHGQIGLRSTVGQGSTFWFTAEFEDPVEPAPRLALAPSLLERHRALIVDDNATNRKLLTHLCNAWQLKHRVADGALAALEHLRDAARQGRPIDLVILDHHMPDIDGLGFAAMLRAEPSIPRPTIVLLTSRGERLAPARMQELGLAACELKPLHAEKLRSTLARVMADCPPLPVADTPEPTAARPPRPSPAPPEATVLIAEDNPVNQKVALLQLRTLGYGADVVGNGREAIDALRRKPYRIVLMDSQMPEMDGIAATRRIRELQAAADPGIPRDVQIVAMTANAMAGDREIFLSAGMDAYLTKPVTLPVLRDTLAACLERASHPTLPVPCEPECVLAP